MSHCEIQIQFISNTKLKDTRLTSADTTVIYKMYSALVKISLSQDEVKSMTLEQGGVVVESNEVSSRLFHHTTSCKVDQSPLYNLQFFAIIAD